MWRLVWGAERGGDWSCRGGNVGRCSGDWRADRSIGRFGIAEGAEGGLFAEGFAGGISDGRNGVGGGVEGIDAVFAVGVDGRVGAKHEAGDVGEDGGAAGRDLVGGEEIVEAAEAEVDALGGLEVFPVDDQLAADVGGVGLLLSGEVIWTEVGVRVTREGAALAAGGGAMGTAGGEDCGFRVGWHGDAVPAAPGSFLSCELRGTHPGCFCERVWKMMKRREIEIWKGQKSLEQCESKGDRLRSARASLGR